MKRFMLMMVMLLGVVALSQAAEPKAAPAFEADKLEGEKGPYLIGPLTRDAWLEFAPELKEEAVAYIPSPDLVKALSYYPDDVTVTCVLGTWCHDSQREVPRFWSLLDKAAAPGIMFTMIAVGRNDAPEALIWEGDHGIVPGYRNRFDIEYVPTFIVSNNGVEIGRIVETPEVTLEADLANILGLRADPAWH
jgi:thioredoxin 1